MSACKLEQKMCSYPLGAAIALHIRSRTSKLNQPAHNPLGGPSLGGLDSMVPPALQLLHLQNA